MSDTLEAGRLTFAHWAEQVSTPENPVRYHFVEVSFEKAADGAELDYPNNIGTNFNLSDKEVDRLISAAGQILRQSPEFKAFLDANRK